MAKYSDAERFQVAFDKVSQSCPDASLVLETLWSRLYERHWPITLVNEAQWQTLLGEIVEETKLPYPDVCSHVRKLLNADKVLSSYFTRGMASVPALSDENIIRETMFGSYDEVVELLTEVLSSTPGTTKRMIFTERASVFASCGITLVWMGMRSKDAAKIPRNAVSFSEDGQTVHVALDGPTPESSPLRYSLRHEYAAAIFRRGLELSLSEPRDTFFATTYDRDFDEVSKAIDLRKLKHIDTLCLFRSGIFYRVAEELKAQGRTPSQIAAREFGELIGPSQSFSQNTLRVMLQHFHSWWAVYVK